MAPEVPGGLVSLAMYPFDQLRAAWEQLWSAIAADLPGWPSRLDWETDPRALWGSPDMLVAQTCSWPLVTRLRDRVHVVGSFGFEVETGQGYTYRSTIVASRAGTIESFAGAAVAVNDPESMSGWVSLRHEGMAFGQVLWTGSHVESVRAVREGRAELAAIDPVSLEHIGRFEPQLVASLQVVGHGPRVPTVPIIAGTQVATEEIELLRSSLTRHAPQAPDELRITSFHPLDLDAYAWVSDLDPDLFAEQSADARFGRAGDQTGT